MDQPSGTGASTNVTQLPRPALPQSPPSHSSPPPAAPLDAAAPAPSPLTRPATVKQPAAIKELERQNEPPIAHATADSKTGFWLTHADQLVLAILSALMLALLAAYWVRLTRWGTVPIEIEHLDPRHLDFRLDVNSATWVEFGQLDGIGDALARRIVADREQNGRFRSIDDLRRVKGIGPKILERARPWLTIEPESTPPRRDESVSDRAAAPH